MQIHDMLLARGKLNIFPKFGLHQKHKLHFSRNVRPDVALHNADTPLVTIYCARPFCIKILAEVTGENESAWLAIVISPYQFWLRLRGKMNLQLSWSSFLHTSKLLCHLEQFIVIGIHRFKTTQERSSEGWCGSWLWWPWLCWYIHVLLKQDTTTGGSKKKKKKSEKLARTEWDV